MRAKTGTLFGLTVASVVELGAVMTLGSVGSTLDQPTDSTHSTPVMPVAYLGPVHPATSPLKFETTSHDFGIIDGDTPVSFDFKFRNITGRVVAITGLTASSGTIPRFEKQCQPGAEESLTVSYNPRGRDGREAKTVALQLDDTATPILQLQLVADVRRRVILEPGQVYMGEVDLKATREQTFTLAGRAENFDITGVEVRGVGYTIVQTGSDTVDIAGEQLRRFSYKVSFDGAAEIGRAQAVAVFATNDAMMPTVSLSLITDVVGQLRVNPPVLGVKMSAPDQPFTAVVRLENRGAQPFRILGVEFEPVPGVDLNAVLDVTRPGQDQTATCRIRLTGTTPASVTELRGMIRIRTDVQAQAEISVPVLGFQVPNTPSVPPDATPAGGGAILTGSDNPGTKSIPR